VKNPTLLQMRAAGLGA